MRYHLLSRLTDRLQERRLRQLATAALVSGSLALGACSSSDDDSDPSAADDPTSVDPAQPPSVDEPDVATPDETVAANGLSGLAFVAGNTPSFDAGQIERFELGESITAAGTYPPTLADIRVRTDGSHVYQVGRFQIDSLTKYSPTELSTPLYQYSVNGDETAANPYDVVFVDETKAYVIRYGSPLVWIINPQAATEEDFKIGEIDLSAYDDDAPNAADGLIVDGKLYVLMQRLTEFTPDKTSYVAVIDTSTDTEIDTGQGQDGLPGIALSVVNGTGLQYVESLQDVLVTAQGNAFGNEAVPGDPYQGGIEAIDVDTYEASLLVDDGTADSSPGFFVDSLVVSGERGYVLTYQDFGSTTLRSFNPLTGLLDEPVVADLQGQDISVLENGPSGDVWIGLQGMEPGLVRLDPVSNTLRGERIATQFNPTSLVFIDDSAADDNVTP